MQKIKLLLISTAVLIFLTACSTNRPSLVSMSPLLDKSTQNRPTQTTIRLLIRTANLEIEVEQPKDTISKIEAIVKGGAGYVDNLYERDQKRASMTVKIPVKNLDSFIKKISSLGTLISKSLNTRDVSKKMIDIKARLTNLKALRDRFRKLLGKAQNVSDLLKIEAELSRIQTELDTIEARRKSLKNQIALSRVDITITQKTIYGPFGYLGKGLYWAVKKLFVIK